MLIVNVGTQGIRSFDKLFEPGVNVEVTKEQAKYLCEKYGNPKMAVYFQDALNSIEHEAVQEPMQGPLHENLKPVVKSKRRGRSSKK